jgi:hypothetical protein
MGLKKQFKLQKSYTGDKNGHKQTNQKRHSRKHN